LKDFAGLKRNESSEGVFVLPDELAKDTHQIAALGRRNFAPSKGGMVRARKCCTDLSFCVCSYFCKQSAINRRVNIETLRIAGWQCKAQGFENAFNVSAVTHDVLLTFYAAVPAGIPVILSFASSPIAGALGLDEI
jgi:hypothetical protein